MVAVSDIDNSDKQLNNNGNNKEKGITESILSYPKGVFFMLGNEFCERFSFYGMRAILIIYLTTDYQLSENVAKQYYHVFVSLAYLSPLFGSVLADNYFGRFHVILWVSLIYVLGHLLLSIGAIPFLEKSAKLGLDISGLAVIAIATGGIKPCVSAFAADQFRDDQHRERTQFFSFFYFAINAGSLIAIAVTPLLRRVRCLDSEHCFPLAFGVPGVLMLLAFLTFLAGWRFYKITPASKGNILWRVVKCICYALRAKLNSNLSRKRTYNIECQPSHWLDYALPKYDAHLVAGVKSMVSIVVLYIPVVFFWALFDQQGSTWVLQATRMDGHVGWFTILPDQMNTLNPLFVLILVPMFEAWIYPMVNRICKITPLRKMALGGILAAVAFCIAGFVQIKINSTMEPKPAIGNSFIYRMGNASNVELFAVNGSDVKIRADNGKQEIWASNYTFETRELNNDNILKNSLYLALEGEVAPKSYVLGVFEFPNGTIIGFNCTKTKEFDFTKCIKYITVEAQMGAAFVIDLVQEEENNNSTTTNNNIGQLVRSNSVSILWQFPQVLVMTIGEILFSVTGLEFSYSQAAPSMKSVLQALWLLTVFFGNVVDVIISHLEIPDPVAEFFIYATLMFLVIGIFIILAVRYIYVDEHNLEIPDTPEQIEESTEKINNNINSTRNRRPTPFILEKENA
uniref:Oligopeptide transporter 1 n=1 Tax=Meloidogyne javanica TaxID=6303 RepID=A0A915MSS3_MELJA